MTEEQGSEELSDEDLINADLSDEEFREKLREHSRKRIESLSDEELLAGLEQVRKNGIMRDEKGRFEKGAPSPNPRGRPKRKPRHYGLGQTEKDLLERLEQPVTVKRKGADGRTTTEQTPVIVAIYAKMIEMAVGGNWSAMRKCIELREKYANSNEDRMAGMLIQARNIEMRYERKGVEVPEDERQLIEQLRLLVNDRLYARD